jgi:hypothetical protein
MLYACHESKPEPPLKIMIPSHETEVFRLNRFSKDKAYEFALYTKKKGWFPNDKYYANTDSLKYVGYWVSSERWGGECGDGRGGAENFIDNGKKNRIVYDYDGKTCFVEALLIPRESDHVQKGTHEVTPL